MPKQNGEIDSKRQMWFRDAVATTSAACLLLSNDCAFEPTGLSVELSAAVVLFGSSVHPIHDLDHAELVERSEVVRDVNDIIIGTRRGHRHCENERVY